jgi:hypothetical protein
MGVVSACTLSFMSKYLHQSCSPKPITRVYINDNNQSSNIKDDMYRFMNDIVYYKGRIYLVPKSSFKRNVLQAFHDSPVA